MVTKTAKLIAGGGEDPSGRVARSAKQTLRIVTFKRIWIPTRTSRKLNFRIGTREGLTDPSGGSIIKNVYLV